MVDYEITISTTDMMPQNSWRTPQKKLPIQLGGLTFIPGEQKKVFKRLQNQPLNWRSCNAAKKKADSNFPLSNLLFFAKHGQQQIRQTSYSNTIHGSGIFTYTLIPWNFKPFADPVNTLDSSHGSVMGWDLKPPGASLVEGPVAWIQWQLADADWWHHQWDFIKNTSSVPTCVFWCNKNGVKK